MKYEEALKNNIEKFDNDGIMMRSLVLPYFLQSISLLLCMLSENLCRLDFPTASVSGEECGGGKGEKVPSVSQILKVLSHSDFLRSTNLTQSLIQFLDWLLEQELPEDIDDFEEGMWYDSKNIIDKWNEFVTREDKTE